MIARNRPPAIHGEPFSRLSDCPENLRRSARRQEPSLAAETPPGSSSADRLLEIFGHLNDDGVTIVLVTHDLHVAEVARRQVAMKDGRVVDGEVARVH